MSVVLIILTCVAALSGAAVGFFRKFSKTSFCGLCSVLTLLIVMAVGGGVTKASESFGVSLIIATVVVLAIFFVIFTVLQKLMAKKIEAKIQLSHYKNADEIEENEAFILSAVDSGDKKEYKKRLKEGKKIKDSAGVWGWIDRAAGAVNGLFNGLVSVAVIIIILLMFADFSRINGFFELFEPSLYSAAWLGTGSKIALDLPLICALFLSIRTGYKSGISSTISVFVVLGLLIGFGFASWAIASSAACASAVEGLKSGLLSTVAAASDALATTIGQVILAGIIFLLSLIVVVLVAIFLPKIFNKFSENKIFETVDGVIGAIVSIVFLTLVLIVVGGITATLSDLEFMARFNEYAALSNFGDALYSKNPLASSFASLPLRSLFGS